MLKRMKEQGMGALTNLLVGKAYLMALMDLVDLSVGQIEPSRLIVTGTMAHISTYITSNQKKLRLAI